MQNKIGSAIVIQHNTKLGRYINIILLLVSNLKETKCLFKKQKQIAS